jgi:hypothetical protein
VNDFSCEDLPDNYFDFLFSCGTFCHIAWAGQCAYCRNPYCKMHPGANAMAMFADFDKYDHAVRNAHRLRVRRIDGNIVWSSVRDIFASAGRFLKQHRGCHTNMASSLLVKDDKRCVPGQWCHAGIQETCRVLLSLGWQVIDPDVGVNLRDPIIHFRKPCLSGNGQVE